MALHTGEAQLRDERNYWGSAVNRTGRLRALAHGGQTILSRSTYELAVDHLPENASLKDLGVVRMRDRSRSENVWQLCHPDLRKDFPPLRSVESAPNNLPIHTESSSPTVSGKTIRLVLAEDNYLVREGTAALLREIEEIDLIEAVEDLDSLLDAVDRHNPDAVITDIRMPPTQTREGVDAAKRIRESHPNTGVLLLSQYVEEAYVRELVEGDATGFGYLLKERVRDVDQLVQALRSVTAGGLVLDPRVVEELISARERAAHAPLKHLTERELEVLEQMAQGRTNAAIAKTLFLSERSVERHINSIFSKLGLSEEADVHRRVRAVLAFLEEGRTS
jgi:DNA-binding NarL/FixJ family response regulator